MQGISRLTLPLAYMAGIYLLSSIPDDGAPETLAEQLLQWATPELQNLFHIPLFGGLAASWHWALAPLATGRRTRLFLVLLITAAYSFFDEWHQLHVPGRYGSLTDIALNLVGVAGVLLYLAMKSPGSVQLPTEADHKL